MPTTDSSPTDRSDSLLDRVRELREDAARSISRLDEYSISRTIKFISDTARAGGRIWTAGNGGSASTASHLAADLNKWASDNKRHPVMASCLSDNVTLLTSLVNDLGWDRVYEYQIAHFATSGDVFIAISVHGGVVREDNAIWSSNLVKGIEAAKRIGCKCIGISGHDGGIFRGICDIIVILHDDSTPIIEGLHVVITHIIAEGLRLHGT